MNTDDFGALIIAAGTVAASRDSDPDLRELASNFLYRELEAASNNPDGPEDDPAQTDVGEGDPEPAE